VVAAWRTSDHYQVMVRWRGINRQSTEKVHCKQKRSCQNTHKRIVSPRCSKSIGDSATQATWLHAVLSHYTRLQQQLLWSAGSVDFVLHMVSSQNDRAQVLAAFTV
jgi:hypothetical protein